MHQALQRSEPPMHAVGTGDAGAPSMDSLGALINLAGRQRMLSQRIVLQASMAVHGVAAARDRADEALALFRKTHALLVEGDGTARLPGLFSDRLRQVFFGSLQADARIREFIASAQKSPQHADEVLELAEQASVLLDTLNAVTGAYEEEAKSRARSLQKESVELLGDIQSIAKQARIVAFNARVAAARAGAPGREFAAVAGVLAEITDRIEGMVQRALSSSAAR